MQFTQDDIGNSFRFAHRNHNHARYCPDFKSWMIFNGKFWELDRSRQVWTLGELILTDLRRIASNSGSETLTRHATNSAQSNRFLAMIEHARNKPGMSVMARDLDKCPELLNVSNGTLDLATGKVKPHNPNHLITKYIDIHYEEDLEPVVWLKFLREVMMGDEDLVEFLQRGIGYSLSGLVSDPALFILYGDGENGKSTFINTLMGLLGEDYSRQIATETLMHRSVEHIPSDLARLRGARWVTAQETNEGISLDEAKIKQLTGNDFIVAREMRKNEFQFRPEFKLWLACNHRPVIKGTDRGIWRRLKLVPFRLSIKDHLKDHRLEGKLQGEYQEILSWAVAGFAKWEERRLAMPEAAEAAVSEFQVEMDTLGRFLAEGYVEDPQGAVNAGDLFDDFALWSDSCKEPPVSQTSFGRAMTRKGFVREKDSNSRRTVYRGLKVAK